MENVLLGGLSSSLATVFTNPLEVRWENRWKDRGNLNGKTGNFREISWSCDEIQGRMVGNQQGNYDLIESVH
jgi:hypothetical protein